MSGAGDQEEGYVVKLRGLPWSVTTEDILKFFEDCEVMNDKNGVHLTTSREGRPSGEAYVEFETADDLEMALEKDRDHIGSRYIEVFKVDKSEMEWMVKRSGPSFGSNDDGCVRLRGLPFGCSKEEIAQFFTGLEIVPNGITLLTDYSGRSSGEAYVQFVNKDVAEKALQKHREKIGHRYIEIFRSSLSEIASALGYTGNRRSGSFNNRPSPYDRGDRYGGGMGGGGGGGRFQGRGSRNFKGSNYSNDFNNYNRPSGGGGGGGWSGGNQNGGGRFIDPWNNNPSNDGASGGGAGGAGSGSGAGMHCVHMRGIPFKASQLDIADFFKPVMPVSIRLLQDHSGRASGEADVEFASHEDAMRAMSKDKSNMQHRYIELFLNSAGGSSGGGGGGGGYGGRRRL